MRFDEINKLNNDFLERIESLTDKEIEDSLLDLLILSYVYGNSDANLELKVNTEVDNEKMVNSINKKINGDNYSLRVQNSLKSNETPLKESIKRILDTETTRNYNQAKLDVGLGVNGAKKRWETLEDERVRDTHSFLQGVEVGINEKFYTYDGDSAMCPGDFESATNNCNCRCYLILTR